MVVVVVPRVGKETLVCFSESRHLLSITFPRQPDHEDEQSVVVDTSVVHVLQYEVEEWYFTTGVYL